MFKIIQKIKYVILEVNMKYVDSTEMTIATKRTLKNLREALKDLLKIKAFENISIQELCDKAMISRGTFYNYFYDKYDLLNYDWSQLQLELDPEFTNPDLKSDDYEKYMNLFLENLITYLSEELEIYRKINNTNANSIFFINMHEYIAEQILLKLREAIEDESKYRIPIELLATVYANTIITVGRWWLQHGEIYTKEEVHRFFSILIGQDVIFKEKLL